MGVLPSSTWQDVRVTGRSFTLDFTGLRQIAHNSQSFLPLLPLDEEVQHECGDFGVQTLLGKETSRLNGDPFVFRDGVRKIDKNDSAEGSEKEDPLLRRRVSDSCPVTLALALGVDEELSDSKKATSPSPDKFSGRDNDGAGRDSG